MIKASELRIGNLCDVKDTPIVIKCRPESFPCIDTMVLPICASDIVAIDKRLMDFKPIPISEEWLKIFSFENVEECYWLHRPHSTIALFYHISYKPDTLHLVFLSPVHNIHDYIEKYFKYVHELQNVWFALTGEELTLNNTQP